MVKAFSVAERKERGMDIHQDYGTKTKAYETLYRAGERKAAGKGGGGTATSFDNEHLAALAMQLVSISPDDYRAAMWLRRAWLHRNGRDGNIYDGVDPVRWCRWYGEGMRQPFEE